MNKALIVLAMMAGVWLMARLIVSWGPAAVERFRLYREPPKRILVGYQRKPRIW